MDESYWQDNERVERYLQGYNQRASNRSFEKDKDRDYKGRCTICLNPDTGVARLLIKVGQTSKRKLDVWACPVCDAGLLDNIDRGAHNI